MNQYLYYMSIIIKANELNTLIYKYFLEAGLTHSAFTFFNEASLAQSLQEFRFDIKAGHLLSLLQKALIYSKIQAHVNFSEYTDCEQPFHLLKSHTCKVVEKVRKERDDLLKDMSEQINDGIRRTNSIYNTAIPNKQFQEIVYEARGKRYLEKFAKIKLPANQNNSENQPDKFKLTGTEIHTLLYNSDDFEIDLLKYDSINEDITIEKIFPSVRQGQLARSIHEAVTPSCIVQLFDGNQVTLFDLSKEELAPIEFTVPVDSQLTTIDPNPNISQLICFKNQGQYCIVNTNNFRIVRRGQGSFHWRAFDEYLLVEDNSIKLYSVSELEPKQLFQSTQKWDEIQFNSAKNLFVTISYITKSMQVYTFDSDKPLFIFNFEDKTLRQAIFVTSNSVDYLCWLTTQHIKVFDLSLNSYSKIIDIQDYDSQINQLCVLKKADKDELYLLALGSENLVIYDLSNSKTERVEMEGRVCQLKQLGETRVALIAEGHIYFLVGQYIDVLFK